MLRNRIASILCGIAMVMGLSAFAVADRGDRVQIGNNIVVQANEKVGDVVCILCSIHVRGQTAGDVVAVGGSIWLETGAQIAGDAVAVGGSLRLDSGTQVAGSVTTVGGAVRRDPQAMIAGDMTALTGAGWMLLILATPLILFGGFVALIIWLLQRSRPTAPAPAYPGTPTTRA